MKLSCIITVRGKDNRLAYTTQRIRRTVPKAEIIVVVDGEEPGGEKLATRTKVLRPWCKPQGVQSSRDHGIMAARGDVVCVLDAHMALPQGWEAAILETVENHHGAVVCPRCHYLTPKTFPTMPSEQGWNAGADLYVMTKEGKTPEYWALSGKWTDSDKPREIACLMGGCYAFTRDWYEHLGRPWQFGTSWGMDEELLSAATWIAGGQTRLAGADVGHEFERQSVIAYDASGQAGVWANRFRMLFQLPCSDELKGTLCQWMEQSAAVKELQRVINKHLIVHSGEIIAWRESFPAVKGRTLDSWIATWRKNAEPIEPKQYSTPNERKADRAAETARDKENDERRTNTANPVVIDPGVKCPHCAWLYGHKITHTYPNGNRRRLCAACGKPFVTMRKNDPVP